MEKIGFKIIVLLSFGLNISAWANTNTDADVKLLFQQLDDRTQEVKLRILDLNRDVNKYAAKSKKDVASLYKGKNRTEYTLDLVDKDFRNKRYLEAINRYHAGRDFGVISSKYETALKVANIYLDYGLYHYSKKIFKSLLGDEDTAVASLARFYLAKHNFLKHYWDEALEGFESVTDGLPAELMDKKRIMQSIILQDRKQHDEVIAVLSEIPKTSEYYHYARFNIAMSYLRKGWWSDVEENIRQILAQLKADDVVTHAFRDRLYIALGYYQLQREYYREAYDTLSKVSENGPYGYKAQLGIGIVAAEQGKYQESLTVLNTLKDTYSKQLVTEEAYILIPFVLESIGSISDSLKYYADAGKFYTYSISDIKRLQTELHNGVLDDIFTAIETGHKSQEPRVDSNLKQSRTAITRYISNLEEDSQWNEALQNLKDIAELNVHLERLNALVEKSGKYDAKGYKNLLATINKTKNTIAVLEKDYREFDRIYLADFLNERRQYFISYLNQSQYALARINDTALGDNAEIMLAGSKVTEASVRDLYRIYLASAIKESRNRRAALIRLAKLEFDAYELYLSTASENTISPEAKHSLDNSVELLETALQDYPDKKDNDTVLYQLAVAYDKQQQPSKVTATMRQLVDNFPQSRFYTEIQFKLGENYLTSNESIDAELAYSAAVNNGEKNSIFYQRALYKRGWARLRQSAYEDALTDFFEVLSLSHYGEKEKLSPSENEFMNDVLRAISLCFEDMGGKEPLNHYFAKHKLMKYSYVAYEKLGEQYESEGRTNDAAELYMSFIQQNNMSPHAPDFMIKIVNAWKKAGVPNKELEARALLETKFALNNQYWVKNHISLPSSIRETLESNVVFMASHFHSRFQRTHSIADLQQSKYWYEQFEKYALLSKNASKTYFMFAELLSDAGEGDKAVTYYEKANKGNNSDATKEAAYAVILTTDSILKKSASSSEQDRWLFKKADYSLKYVTQYPKDKRSPEVLLDAVEGLYTRKLFNRALALIERSPVFVDVQVNHKIQMYEANCYFELAQYESAEKIYQTLYGASKVDDIDKRVVADRLAVTIYKQGEIAEKAGDAMVASALYMRVVNTVPDSSYSATASYDAANVLFKSEKYKEAKDILESFQKNYPGHKLQTEVNNKLAIIYLKESDYSKSAEALRAVADDSSIDKNRRRDALWQAANLYNEAGDSSLAIQAYVHFSELYSDNHEQTMEALAKLAELYAKTNDSIKQHAVLQSMLTEESKVGLNSKTDRTQFLAAHAEITLMKQVIADYNMIAIREPLKITLARKKNALKDLVVGLTKVSNYSIEDTTTWAIYNIGEAYREFSRALLKSPRPDNLHGTALEQYEILLEEQAYPFEEKALGYYKANLENVKTGIYNEWVKNSLRKLALMEPVRYDKKEKLESYIDSPLEYVGITTASH